MQTSSANRPGVVTFVGLLLYLQSLIAVFTATVAIIFKNETDFQASTGRSADELLVIGLAEAVIAVILLVAAMGVMTASQKGRTVAAVVIGVRVAVASWAILTHHSGGIFTTSVLTILISVFVLWSLYGNEAADDYFS
jgi:hypothetical protein